MRDGEVTARGGGLVTALEGRPVELCSGCGPLRRSGAIFACSGANISEGILVNGLCIAACL